jgi:hypothetical protein
VTPTMSKQCVDGNYSKIPGNRTQNAHFRSRLSHGNDGRFLGLEGGGHPRKDSPNSRAEEADHYSVVARLNRKWRVIVCAAGIQWILQRCTGERHGTARWEGRSYCRTREALNRLSRKRAGAIDPTAAGILASLPQRIAIHQDESRPAPSGKLKPLKGSSVHLEMSNMPPPKMALTALRKQAAFPDTS